MRDTIIRVENLGKKYKIGGAKVPYKTLRESLVQTVSAPLKRVKRMLSGEQYGAADVDEEIWALKDISFEVKRGDVLGIIGRNGAGKSTLLKILSRITEPTEGRAKIHGRVGSLLEVGTGFHPELTGRENVFLNGAILGMRKIEIDRKFDEIVAFSEIEKFIDTPVKFYSSGMYVRLAFAVAAHLEPDILLVDEVLAVGDVAFQRKCLGKMGDVAKEGRTVMFVSHNMGAIQRLCPTAIWLKKGTVSEIGEVTAICEKYLYSDMEFGSGVHTFNDGAGHAIQFLRAEIFNEQDELKSIFGANELIKFRITYRIKRNIKGASIALNICNSNGESLWGVSDLDAFPEFFEGRKAGTWFYECIAPANVLRPGRYLVALGAGTGVQYFHHPTKFPFEITTTGYWRRSYHYFGVKGGPVVVPMKVTMPVECDIDSQVR